MILAQTLKLAAGWFHRQVWNRWRTKANPSPASRPRQLSLETSDLVAYHELLRERDQSAEVVDDASWSDLEMDKVFARLDGAATPLGAQFLYALLRRDQSNQAQVESNTRLRTAFAGNRHAVQKLRAALAALDANDSVLLARFLMGTPPPEPAGYRYFYALSAAAIVCPLLVFLHSGFILPMVALWILNIVVHWRHGRDIVRDAPALKALAVLLGCVPSAVRAIEGLGLDEHGTLARLEGLSLKLRKQLSQMFLRRGATDDLALAVTEYLNMFCLFELSACCRSLVAIGRHADELRRIFETIARLDAFQGLSTTLSGFKSLCVPAFAEGRAITLVEVIHPLVDQPVGNTLETTGKSLLLSGTNMAGKTTFMRTVAINLILAQSIGVCLAVRAVLPRVRVRTLINRSDTPQHGESYFFFEAARLLRLLDDATRDDHPTLFVIDEIFRGTNTIERVAAGTAVLSHLNQFGIVIASTHDTELSQLLRDEFELYHFAESLDAGAAHFDYKLRPGECQSRNAIKLLVTAGYARDVTDRANQLVETLTAKRARD
jgi:DNA mismatch repair ATPase MutS